MKVWMELANVLATLISIYSFLIWLRILMTWITGPLRIQDNGFFRFLRGAVDPYLGLFSNIKALRRDRLDLTPLVALAVLSVVQSILRMFGAYGTLTPGMVFATILQTFWDYIISPFFWFFFIILVIRLIFCYYRSPNSIAYINMLDSMDRGVLNFVQKIFFGTKAVNDRTLVWTSVIFYLVCFIAGKSLLSYLITVMVR